MNQDSLLYSKPTDQIKLADPIATLFDQEQLLSAPISNCMGIHTTNIVKYDLLSVILSKYGRLSL